MVKFFEKCKLYYAFWSLLTTDKMMDLVKGDILLLKWWEEKLLWFIICWKPFRNGSMMNLDKVDSFSPTTSFQLYSIKSCFKRNFRALLLPCWQDNVTQMREISSLIGTIAQFSKSALWNRILIHDWFIFRTRKWKN